jgi:phosphoglycolate phosphatase-like HAD superfamily hydrolase
MVQAVVFDVGETLVNESRLWRLSTMQYTG